MFDAWSVHDPELVMSLLKLSVEPLIFCPVVGGDKKIVIALNRFCLLGTAGHFSSIMYLAASLSCRLRAP